MTGSASSGERAFVVQFRPETDVSEGRFEGRVEQIASGEGARFRSLEELIGSLKHVLAGSPRSREPYSEQEPAKPKT
jgi:hypothetical protein